MRISLSELKKSESLSENKPLKRLDLVDNPLLLAEVCRGQGSELIIAYGEWGNAVTMHASEVKRMVEGLQKTDTLAQTAQGFLDRLEKMAHVRITREKGPYNAHYVSGFLPIVIKLLENDEHIERHGQVAQTIALQAPEKFERLCMRRKCLMSRALALRNAQKHASVLNGLKTFRKNEAKKQKSHIIIKQIKAPVASFCIKVANGNRVLRPLLAVKGKDFTRG